MTTIRKTGYAVAKRASFSGRILDVFGTVSSKSGVTHVMDADSYQRAAKRAGRVLRSSTGWAPSAAASAVPAESKK